MNVGGESFPTDSDGGHSVRGPHRVRGVVEPTLVLTIVAACLYYFGSYLHARYAQVIGVPWVIPCTPHECITAGFEVTFPVLALGGVLVWVWMQVKPGRPKFLLGNLPYLFTGVLLVLYGASVFIDETTDWFYTALGAIGVAAGIAAFVAGVKRVRSGRSWTDEAARREWRAWTVLAVGFFLAQFIAAEYKVGEMEKIIYSSNLEGTPLASMPAVFIMKDESSAVHGREVQVLDNALGKFYAYDYNAACPSPAHTGGGTLCLYVIMESEVKSIEFPKVWV